MLYFIFTSLWFYEYNFDHLILYVHPPNLVGVWWSHCSIMLKISYPYAISHLVKLLTILLFINLFIFWVFDLRFRKYLLHTSCCTDAKIALKTWLEIVTFRLWNILVTYFDAHTRKLYWKHNLKLYC